MIKRTGLQVFLIEAFVAQSKADIFTQEYSTKTPNKASENHCGYVTSFVL